MSAAAHSKLSDEEREALELWLLDRLRACRDECVRVPWSKHTPGLYLWQLGGGGAEVELALFRLRKRGLVVLEGGGAQTGVWKLR